MPSTFPAGSRNVANASPSPCAVSGDHRLAARVGDLLQRPRDALDHHVDQHTRAPHDGGRPVTQGPADLSNRVVECDVSVVAVSPDVPAEDRLVELRRATGVDRAGIWM